MGKILVVDDEAGVLHLCKKLLTRENHQVFTAQSVDEALKLTPVEMFDLVLTDLKMPEKNGIELVKILKSSYPFTEIIVMTGGPSLEVVVETLKEGAYDFIAKPFDMTALASSVNKAIDHASLKRRENVFREIMYLHEISKEMGIDKTETELIDFLLERVVKTLKADSGSVFIYDKESEKLLKIAVYGLFVVEDKREVSVGEHIVGWIAEKKQPLLLQDGLDNMPQFKDLPKRHDIVSSMVAPLLDKGTLIGVICLNRYVSTTNYQFSPHDLESLQIFVAHMTLILSALRHSIALQELDKLKSEFLANVSHELRTPLMSISGAVELLLPKINDNKQNMLIDLVTRNIKRMMSLVNDLLEFSRPEASQKKLALTVFSIEELINETVEDYDFKAKEKEITLIGGKNNRENDIAITADREKIKQVIANLIGNALKFTPNKGQITIHHSLDNGNNVLVTVQDTGMGIPKNKKELVFEKFYQIDGSSSRSQQGFGLGLAIVKSIVLAHHGKVWVESEPDKGSTFFVLLPLAPPDHGPVTVT